MPHGSHSLAQVQAMSPTKRGGLFYAEPSSQTADRLSLKNEKAWFYSTHLWAVRQRGRKDYPGWLKIQVKYDSKENPTPEPSVMSDIAMR